MYVFEFVQHCRKNVPGCEDAYLLFIAPVSVAAGRAVALRRVHTDDAGLREGKRFDDVIYRTGERGRSVG